MAAQLSGTHIYQFQLRINLLFLNVNDSYKRQWCWFCKNCVIHGDLVHIHGDLVHMHGDLVHIHGDLVYMHGDLVYMHGDLVHMQSQLNTLQMKTLQFKKAKGTG